MPNDTTGAPFNLEQNTPGVPMNSMSVWNSNNAKLNEGAMHKTTYDPTGVSGDAFRASNQKMTGYVKSSEYAVITPSDNASSAIGKLEAGVAATGDMKKATYDTDGDGKVDNAEYADEAGSIQWASVIGRPSVLPNPNALKLQLNGTDAATYTGGAAATVNVTASAIGAASLVGGKVPSNQLDIADETDSTEKTKVASANSVRMAKEEAIAAAQAAIDGIDASKVAYSNPDLPGVTNTKQALDTYNLNIAHENLLDNPYFLIPVNQRGQIVYNGTVYGIDRWRGDFGPSTRLTLQSSGIKLDLNTNVAAASRIYQKIENPRRFSGKTITVSVNCAEISSISGGVSLSYSLDGGNMVYPTSKTITQTGIHSVTYTLPTGNITDLQVFINGVDTRTSGETQGKYAVFSAAKMELGSMSTLANDPPPDYGTELAKCQRYYINTMAYGQAYTTITTAAIARTNNRIFFALPTPSSMRTKPNATILGDILVRLPNATTVKSINSLNATVSSDGSASSHLFVDIILADGTTPFTVGQIYNLVSDNNASYGFAFDANL